MTVVGRLPAATSESDADIVGGNLEGLVNVSNERPESIGRDSMKHLPPARPLNAMYLNYRDR